MEAARKGRRQQKWNKRYIELIEYKNANGDCNVPQNYPNQQLAIWVKEQRKKRKNFDKGDKSLKMTPERIAKLDEIGFEWNPHEESWDDRYNELIEYKKANPKDDCNVPQKYPPNPKLGRWVGTQRQRRKNFDKGDKSAMTQEQIDKLDEIGFLWDASSTRSNNQANEEAWNARYNDLIEYKNANGDCNVPRQYPANPKLGRWVSEQRTKRSKLTPAQVQKLEDIGFAWKLRNASSTRSNNQANEEAWNARYNDLIEYKNANGDCNVPKRYPANPKLGRWVGNQRMKRSKLTPAQVQKLEDIGFVWKLK